MTKKNFVDVARRNGNRMLRLINDLLDIHKLKAGMLTVSAEKVYLQALFEEVATSVSSWVDEHKIKMTLVETDLYAYAEREKVERILFNLVANAIKYSPPGSAITLAASVKADRVQISVSDQGRGIPADQLQNVFERFQQVLGDNQQTSGSGLGLTICQHLVEVMGGRIWVESELNKGSRFYFTLPLTEAKNR